MGGYSPVPLCLAGLLLKKKIYIYEPNQVLGDSNKFFLSHCEKIFCHSKKLKKYPTKFKKKMVLISPLVRKVFYGNKNKKSTKFNLMIIGGSQGAKIFDKHLHEVLLMISKKIDLKVFHQTKESNVKKLKNFYDKNNISNQVFYFQKNFIKLVKNCNFVITRGGASTLAELFILKIPFLAIPLPSSKDNHQYENVKYYYLRNCAWIMNEKKMNFKYSYTVLKKILFNKKIFNSKKNSIIKLNTKISWKKQNKIIINEFYENRN
jgi:UDP-N-acetylglucosamine--N-acetylmuramyl-(pentapeptide) pyrophosphoryl-undecaprenol N-acetylglucosamine transferase